MGQKVEIHGPSFEAAIERAVSKVVDEKLNAIIEAQSQNREFIEHVNETVNLVGLSVVDCYEEVLNMHGDQNSYQLLTLDLLRGKVELNRNDRKTVDEAFDAYNRRLGKIIDYAELLRKKKKDVNVEAKKSAMDELDEIIKELEKILSNEDDK